MIPAVPKSPMVKDAAATPARAAASMSPDVLTSAAMKAPEKLSPAPVASTTPAGLRLGLKLGWTRILVKGCGGGGIFQRQRLHRNHRERFAAEIRDDRFAGAPDDALLAAVRALPGS